VDSGDELDATAVHLTLEMVKAEFAAMDANANAVDTSKEFSNVFKPPPPVGAGGGYMFSGHPSVRASLHASVRPSVRPSVIHVVVLCFRDISSIC